MDAGAAVVVFQLECELDRGRETVDVERVGATGETLRSLALDYEVHHTSLVRFFRRPEAVLELSEARRRLRAECNARQESERRLVRDVRKRAREDEKRDRWLQAWTPPQRLNLSEEMLRLDANDAPRGLTSRERYSENDHKAAEVVASGGGAQEVIEATGLRTLENVLRNIDPQIIRAALANDEDLGRNACPDDRGLRRLLPNSELILRRAAGENLRSIAADYNVSHTTLSRLLQPAEGREAAPRATTTPSPPRGIVAL